MSAKLILQIIALNGFQLDHLEFNKLFDDEFALPLATLGFAYVGKTKSLRYRKGTADLWIKRVSGKWPHPGVARMAICFRHSFLRPVGGDDPDSPKLIVDDFPRKLSFEDFEGTIKPSLNYRPQNTGRWATSEVVYGDKTPENVRQSLRSLRELVKSRVLPWANSITEDGELAQIIKYGEQAWCEKRWTEDYKSYALAQGG